MKFATILRLFPDFLKPLVTRTISSLPSQVRREREFIRPMYEERLARMEELGDEKWDDGPNDMFMWLMNESKGVERSLEGVARRMLGVNFASIHTTSSTMTQVLYRLLANPGTSPPRGRSCRGGVWLDDRWYAQDAQNRQFLARDPEAHGLVILIRTTLRPFTFSNTDPDEFDGFRFARLRESSEGLATSKHQAGVTSPVHVSFGHGRHAWSYLHVLS
ncbi:hypothetical protein EDB92DRAFT_1836651 [Lactarius akahatsu]|uniref:Cytochrome P450 n=1 Tax=Lactarius akahatsu TaxID=416441 RepID=A0AAD4LTB4_9AGAM|nr:hypothetical protein EDB92DRAFT_1836651 [Lactarius akahatsu]